MKKQDIQKNDVDSEEESEELSVEGDDEKEQDRLDNDLKDPNIIAKYKTAADIANKALAAVIAQCVPGKKILELCELGDKTIQVGCFESNCQSVHRFLVID